MAEILVNRRRTQYDPNGVCPVVRRFTGPKVHYSEGSLVRIDCRTKMVQ